MRLTLAVATVALSLIAPAIGSAAPDDTHAPSTAGGVPHHLSPERIETLKAFVRRSMSTLGVPGVAMALVDHGRVVFEGGFGVRELGKPDVVDAHTRFMIGSNTKGMTTLLLSVLVDEGKLAWDEPVTQAYPDFRLGDPETTQKVLIRHLVCACTGLSREDMGWIMTSNRHTPAANTFTLLAAMKPTTKFGEAYQYNNQMAAAAGYVAAHVVHPELELGAAYEAAMQEKVFGPLEMTETTFDFGKALAGDHASPHGLDRTGQRGVASMDFNYTPIAYRPGGGVWSTAHDFIKYAANELSLGTGLDGRRLVSADNLLVRRRANVAIGPGEYYGMGLEGLKIGDILIIHHGGTIVGFLSDFAAIPDADVGAVILTNANQGYPLLRAFMHRLVEVLYDRPPEADAMITAAAARLKAGALKQASEVRLPADPKAARDLAAHYTSPTLGHLDVQQTSGKVRFDFGAWGSDVGTRVGADGKITFVTVDVGIPWTDFIADTRNGKRVLLVKEGNIEHVYTEAR